MAGPFSTIDTVCSRRQAFEYLSPPFCESDFSSSGEVVIVLSPFRRRRGPTGFAASVVNGRIRFRWDTSDGAICYSLYRRDGGVFVLVAECIGDCVEGECTFECEDCGPGTYVVTVILPTGESETSDEVTVGGFAPECPDVAGQPVPTGIDAFDIDAPVEWPEMTVNQVNFFVWPTDPDIYYQEWPEDYPPGHYDIKVVTGFFDGGPSGSDVCGYVHLWGGWDDNYNRDTQLGGPWVTKNVYLADPPFTENLSSGFVFCEPSYAAVEASQQGFWNGGTRRRFKNQERHENDGGKMLAVFNINITGSFDTVPFFDYKLQLIQLDGLIQQPRQVRVQGWEFIKVNFSPALQAWDGVFDVRLDYTSDTLIYEATPGGVFGLLYYVPSGMPSVNGAGWRVEIGGGGGEWRGNKLIDSTTEGQYRRTVDSGNVPACIVIEAVPEEP